jgi:hypothetical protein
MKPTAADPGISMTDNLLALWDRAWPIACLTALVLVNILWLVFLSYELFDLVRLT